MNRGQKSPSTAGRSGSSNYGSPNSGSQDDVRRGFLAAAIATIAGGIVSVFPAAVGLTVFASPLLSRSKSTSSGGKPFRRVASVDSLPQDGTPVQVPVVADLVDAWTNEPNQPIGAVYLRRLADGSVQCFNAICPHAGCFVGFAKERNCFQCPCHTSAFTLDGSSIQPSVSPRDMDELKVDLNRLKEGEVWVQFASYLPGKHEQVEK